jgi:hypothetical protein
MRANIILHTNAYLKLGLIVPAIALLGLTGCSTADGTGRHNYTGWYAQIAPGVDSAPSVDIGSSVYNSESHSFDRPWPFGPESTQQ